MQLFQQFWRQKLEYEERNAANEQKEVEDERKEQRDAWSWKGQNMGQNMMMKKKKNQH